MLKALNEMFALGLSEDALAARAARLGSDCAFFIYNRPMFATGRGEILEAFDIDLSGYRFEIAIPEGIAVSTREAYMGLDASVRSDRPGRSAQPDSSDLSHLPDRSYRPETTDGGNDSGQFCSYRPESRDGGSATPLREALKLPVEQWKDAVVNDFERSVFPLYPKIAELKEEMYAKGAVYAAMTGSGSAVFGIFAE
ncbi:MAG: hypothetical protein J5771_01275 [Bacteroidales bacterium]|nr:hypothetical protein [Bacteroidales bacterium]